MPANGDLRFINIHEVKDSAAARPLKALEEGVTGFPLSLFFFSFPLEYITISMHKQRTLLSAEIRRKTCKTIMFSANVPFGVQIESTQGNFSVTVPTRASNPSEYRVFMKKQLMRNFKRKRESNITKSTQHIFILQKIKDHQRRDQPSYYKQENANLHKL